MKLKELRTKANLTQNDLGKIIGVSSQTILNWENGIYEPKIEHLIKLADHFKVSIDYIVERETKNNNIDEICLNISKITKDEFIDFIKQTLMKK